MTVYKMIYKNGRNIAEHRFIMEQKLGRALTSVEVVHHINGDSLDNSLDNLVLLPDQATHRRVHAAYGPAHMVRLSLEDEETLRAMPGNPSANIRELVRRGLNASPTTP